MTALISYSQDLERVRLLAQVLRRHGLRVWRDVESLEQGAPTERSIEAELEHCDSAMLWLGGNTLNSAFVCKVELPSIFRHHTRRGLHIVPLFVDVDVATGVTAVRAATGHEIGDHSGYYFDPARTLEEHLAEVASRAVRARLRDRAQPAGARPVVRWVTRSDAADGRDVADLDLNWIAEYPANGDLPDPPTINALQAALQISAHHLITHFGAGPADLFLKCHLHLGVALGFALRRVTGLRPRVDVDGTWWNVDMAGPLGQDQQLVQHMADGPPGTIQAAVEISLTRDVHPMVNDYVATTGTAYRRRVELAPPAGPAQLAVDKTNLNPWAEQVAEAMRALRAVPGVETVDVFLAAPIGFAVALGWRLNAIGGIRLFHPAGNSGPYAHVWTLPVT